MQSETAPFPIHWVEQVAFESTFAIDVAKMGVFRDTALAFLQRHVYSDLMAFDVVLAIDEALTNIALHSYDETDDRRVTLRLSLESDRGGPECVLTVMFKDRGLKGAAYKPAEQLARTRALLELGEPSGLGVLLIHKVMDEVKYAVTMTNENSLIMRKWFFNGPVDREYIQVLVGRLQAQNVLPPLEPDLVVRIHQEHPLLESEEIVEKIGDIVGRDSTRIRKALVQARLADTR